MSERRYVVAYIDQINQEVGCAPANETGDFLTKSEAAQRIVFAMDAVIEQARSSRRRAMRVLATERKKGGAA